MFKRCNAAAAIASIAAGLLTFIITKNTGPHGLAIDVGLPSIISAIVFIGVGFANKTVSPVVTNMMASLKKSTQVKNH
jgi:Na+/proline symporter